MTPNGLLFFALSPLSRPGNTDSYHYDENNFTTTLLLQSAEKGGIFECTEPTRVGKEVRPTSFPIFYFIQPICGGMFTFQDEKAYTGSEYSLCHCHNSAREGGHRCPGQISHHLHRRDSGLIPSQHISPSALNRLILVSVKEEPSALAAGLNRSSEGNTQLKAG